MGNSRKPAKIRRNHKDNTGMYYNLHIKKLKHNVVFNFNTQVFAKFQFKKTPLTLLKSIKNKLNLYWWNK